MRWPFTNGTVHLDKHPDRVTALARAMAERLSPLCGHVPAEELAELTARLATSELMRASSGSVAAEEPMTVSGNQVVWLPGPSGAAIVLPAGETDRPAALPSMSELLERARAHARQAAEAATRGSATLREAATALVNAWQARSRTELRDR